MIKSQLEKIFSFDIPRRIIMKEEQTIVINLSDNAKGKDEIWMNFNCIMEVAEYDKTILFVY